VTGPVREAGLQVRDVAVHFGVTRVLAGVSLDVARGEFVALLGPSGCGKTTLMRAIAGIQPVESGRVVIDGRDVTGAHPSARDVAMVFQSYALYPHLTVAQNIAVPLALRRLSLGQRLPLLGAVWPGARAGRAAIASEVAAMAQSLGLGALLERKPGQLSGGQRQRVALARAVVRRPSVFLMDEPLSNLDASLRVSTRQEIVAVHRRAGAATLYVTHDQTEALTMADRVAVMLGGEILQVASPREIYDRPAELRVARFIGSPRINELPAVADAAGRLSLAGRPLPLRVAARGPVTLALRPEQLRPAAEGLPARLRHAEFLGDATLWHCELPDVPEPVVLRVPPAAVTGAELHLDFLPSDALVFGADGRRLPAEALAPTHA
jgi:multiple sugar transport system ATP-binding protein